MFEKPRRLFQPKRQPPVVYPDEVVRQCALRLLARLFHVPEDALTREMRFGDGKLQAEPPRWYKNNAFDIILEDILYVADRRLRKQMGKGEQVISTVGDYCDHMVRCSALKPGAVADVLELPTADGADVH